MADAATIETANRLLQMAAALQGEKRFAEAEPIFARVHAEFPNDDAALYAYSNNLYELGKLEAAEKHIRQAIKTSPKKPEYWHTLLCIRGKGSDGRELQRLCRDAAARFPEYFPLAENQLMLQIENWELKDNLATTARLLQSPKLDARQKNLVAAARALTLYLKGEIEASRELVAVLGTAPDFGSGENAAYSQLEIYLSFLRKLFAFRENHPEIYAGENPRGEIYVVGDSHVLSPAYAKSNGYSFIPRLTMGLKAWHLSDTRQNRFKHSFHSALAAVPQNARVIFSYGEIDCRLREGIFPHVLQNPGADVEKSISGLVADYISYLGKFIADRKFDVVIAGVPAPLKEYNLRYCRDGEILKKYAEIPRIFNRLLQEAVARAGYKYANLYAASADEQGWARPGCHLDEIHLRPDFYLGALKL